MTVEEDDNLSIYEDAQDKMIPLDDKLPDDVNDLADQCIHQANLHHLAHNTDTTFDDNELLCMLCPQQLLL